MPNLREDQVELLFRLETKFQGNDEGVVDLGKDQAFGKGMGNFISGNNMCLPNCLQGVDTACVTFPNLHDLEQHPQLNFAQRWILKCN